MQREIVSCSSRCRADEQRQWSETEETENHRRPLLRASRALYGYVSATRFNPIIRKFYQHLLAEGKEKKVALVAAMRKFLTILNSLIKKDELWKTSP